MKKIKFVLPVTSLLAIAGLASCGGGSSRDVKPQHNIIFSNCYVKDRTGADNYTPENVRVFPDWAYSSLEQYSEHVREVSEEDINGELGYIRSGDKSNDGGFTISGNNVFQVGEEVNVTLTLNDFVYLNPIDGTLNELHEDPDDPQAVTGYDIQSPVYFKIYVAESVTREYNELKLGEQYFITYDETNPSVIKFRIPAEYVRYSYQVYFSASYLDATAFNFGGFNTLPYSVISGKDDDASAFEKSVPFVPTVPGKEEKEQSNGRVVPAPTIKNPFYKMTNSRVGSDVACVIYPGGMAGGASFTPEYLSRLAFYGVKKNEAEPKKPIIKEITSYVHTNLVHYYANVSNVENDILLGLTSTPRLVSTNTYACRATLPWANPEHPEGGVFTLNKKTGQYSLNYDFIGVNVKGAYKTEEVPFYEDHTEIMTKFKVKATDDKSIKEIKTSFEYVDMSKEKLVEMSEFKTAPYVPTLKIDVTANDEFALNQVFGSLKITSKTTTNGDKYFKDLTISTPEDVFTAFNTDQGYYSKATDYCAYSFMSTWSYTDTSQTQTTINIYLPAFFSSLAFGPDSYSYAADPIHPATNTSLDSTVTLDMIESFEIGVYADPGK